MDIRIMYLNTSPSFTGKNGVQITKDQVLKLRALGLEERSIAKELGIPVTSYYKQLKELGLSLKRSNYSDKLDNISKDEFQTLLKQKYSVLDICKYFNITRTAYYNLLKKFNLKNYMHGAKSVTKEILQELTDHCIPIEKICERLNISKSVYLSLVHKFDIITGYKKSKERVAKVTREDILNLIEGGKTYPKIAEILGISIATLKNLITKMKITTHKLQSKEANGKVTKERLEKLINSGKSIDEICKELNITVRSYSNLVNRFGIMTKIRQGKLNNSSITKEEMQNVVDEGLTVKEMCKKLKISRPIFYHLLRVLDINYNFQHHRNLKELPKDKIEQIVSEWESKEKAEENLDMAVRTFYKKAKEAKVPTIMSESINKLNDLGVKKDEIQMYLDEGATQQDICEMYDISPELYHSLVRKYSLSSSAKKQCEKVNSITKDQLEQLIKTGKSQKQICKELGISSSTLHKKLENFGIKTQKTNKNT